MPLFSAALTAPPAVEDQPPAFRVPHHAPAEERLALLPWLRSLKTNLLAVIPAEAYRAPIVSDRRGPFQWHILSSPSAFRHVFRDNLANYPKAPLMHRMLGPYVGRGLFLADQTAWAWQRKVLAPIFSNSALRQMQHGIQWVADETATRLAAKAGEGPVQMSFEMRVTAAEVVRHTMFSGLAEMLRSIRKVGSTMPDPDQLGAYRSGMQASFDRFLQDVACPGLTDLIGLPAWFRPVRLLRKAPTAEPLKLLTSLVAARRRALSGPDWARPTDLLDLMLAARDPETGRGMQDVEIRDNLMTFILAGSDTVALGLTWAAYVLSQQTIWVDRLRREADKAHTREGVTDVASSLPLTRAFLEEVLRLFPPAPLLIRRARAADRILGAAIAKGDLIIAPIYALHRHSAIWADPHRFDPRRFLNQRPADRYAYLPFGAGSRACIGSALAMLEMQLILATLVRKFDFALASGWEVKPLMMLTLKPDGGLPVLLKPRSA